MKTATTGRRYYIVRGETRKSYDAWTAALELKRLAAVRMAMRFFGKPGFVYTHDCFSFRVRGFVFDTELPPTGFRHDAHSNVTRLAVPDKRTRLGREMLKEIESLALNAWNPPQYESFVSGGFLHHAVPQMIWKRLVVSIPAESSYVPLDSKEIKASEYHRMLEASAPSGADRGGQ